jgi:HlyD family secretion protein
LRFIPPLKEKEAPSSGGNIFSKLFRRRRNPQSKQLKESADNNKLQQVWTLRNGKLLSIDISIGATDGKMTEVTSGDIEPGTPLVVNTMSSEQ